MFGYTTLAVEAPLIITAVVSIVAGLIVGIAIKFWLEKTRRTTFEKELNAERAAAEAEAAKIIAQGEANAKSEAIAHREKFDNETAQTRKELKSDEASLSKRKDLLDQKFETLNSKERSLQATDKAVREKEKSLVEKDQHLNELVARQKTQLLKIADLSREQARDELFQRIEKDMEQECAVLIQKRLDEAKETADIEGREIVISSIQRYAAEHTYDSTISTVDIPSDDMKGRVIGREGRNIRAFEKVTGVDVIVDDTP
ncbi:MAG TPA: DUF3552 domain-containing protein, partial [Phycisphaerae bacterium]|nr:DUF3552 domain-containing protein [Phycisphaerae bacterium]